MSANGLVEYVQEQVRRVYGLGHDEVAACAAVHARTHVAAERDEYDRNRLDAYAKRLEAALELLQADHRHSRAAAEDALHGLLEDLKR